MSPQWPAKDVISFGNIKDVDGKLVEDREVVTLGTRTYPILGEDDWYRMQGRKVWVAYNWNLGLFSIRFGRNGRLFGYAREINLTWVTFDIDQDKAAKVLGGGGKTLHAYVVGEVYAGDLSETFDKWAHPLRYNPRESTFFNYHDSLEGKWIPCIGATGVSASIGEDNGRPKMTAYIPEPLYLSRDGRSFYG